MIIQAKSFYKFRLYVSKEQLTKQMKIPID